MVQSRVEDLSPEALDLNALGRDVLNVLAGRADQVDFRSGGVLPEQRVEFFPSVLLGVVGHPDVQYERPRVDAPIDLGLDVPVPREGFATLIGILYQDGPAGPAGTRAAGDDCARAVAPAGPQ